MAAQLWGMTMSGRGHGRLRDKADPRQSADEGVDASAAEERDLKEAWHWLAALTAKIASWSEQSSSPKN